MPTPPPASRSAHPSRTTRAATTSRFDIFVLLPDAGQPGYLAGTASSMGKIQEEILEAFYEELTKSPVIDEGMMTELRKLLATSKKVKADDVVAILARRSQSGST